MRVVSSRDERHLSNAFVASPDVEANDAAARTCVLIDAGAPLAPLVHEIESRGLRPTHVLLTHHHPDHVQCAGDFVQRYRVPLCGHASEREHFARQGVTLDVLLEHGDVLKSGPLQVRVLHVPGHTLGQLAFVAGEERVFTGDTLFRGSIGGTRGQGHTTLAELRRSLLDVLLALPGSMLVHPGHMDDTTIAEEREHNPFVRYWRGLDAPLGIPVRAYERAATLLVDARDYDGGRKCLVRFDDDGSEDVVGGRRVQR